MQADTGGAVTLNGGSVAATGLGALGLFATGTGSQISATDVTVSTAGSGLSTANAIDADSAPLITVTGGSASTTGTDAFVAGSTNGRTLNLSGTTITATGDGSGGLYANGTGSTVTGTELTITTHGDYDSENNFHAAGIANQSYGEISGGGLVTLTSSSILTTGTQATGVYTANGGTTTINGGSVTTQGTQADAIGAFSGAQVTVEGTTISTSGNASKGFDVEGTGTTLVASNVSVTTTGTIDPATGFHSQGLYNGAGGSNSTALTGGGTATVTDSSFLTKGVDSVAIDTENGAKTTLNGGSYATQGNGSVGVLAAYNGSVTIAPCDCDIGTPTISTSGVVSDGVVADGSGTSASLTGANIVTTGNGSAGAVLVGTGSSMTLSNVSITTSGTTDPSTGHNALGVFNGSGSSGNFPGGGTFGISDSAIKTSGDNAIGVETANGGLRRSSAARFQRPVFSRSAS